MAEVLGKDLRWMLQSPAEKLDLLKLHLLRDGKRVVDLSMINPDLSPPRELRDRLTEALLKSDNHRYAVSRGIRALRAGFAADYKRRYELALDAETQVCATLGTKDGISSVLKLLTGSKRDEVLIAAPSYPAHVSAVRLAGFRPRFFDLSKGFDAVFDTIADRVSSNSLRAVLFNSPNNPTSFCASAEFFRRIYELCRKHEVFLLNDFVYSELQFSGEPAPSLLAAAEEEGMQGVLELRSLSKSHSVPGWRIGAACGDRGMIKALSRYKSLTDYGNFLPLQIAAGKALTDGAEYAAEARQEYRQRAEFFSAELRAMGWELETPEAGCCVWARIPEDFKDRGAEFVATELLTQASVLPSLGGLYGEQFGDYLRFALVQPIHELEFAAEQMRRTRSSFTSAE